MSDLPSDWAEATLAEVAVEVRSGFASGKHNAQGLGVPHLRPMNVSRLGEIDLVDVKYVDPEKDDRRLEVGDILFNNTNSPALVGKTAVVRQSGDFAFSNHMTRIRVGRDIEPEFVAAQLHYLWLSGQLAPHINNHVNQASISAKRLASRVRLRIPPAAEQQRIVESIETHLGSIGRATVQLEHAKTLVKALRRSAIAEVFDEADWDWTTLGEIAEVRGGVTKDSKRQDDPRFVEVPYLRVANVQRGFLDLDEVSTIRVPPEKASALALEPNDILFNEGGDRDKLGRGWIWDGQIPRCIHQNHVFRARLRDGGFDPRFISTHGNTWGQAWFEKHGKQTTNLASINLTTLKLFPVPAPPIDEQRQLMDRLDELTTQLGSLEAEINAAMRRGESMRRAVLAAAFSGQLVPQITSEEPATELLERIRAERPTNERRSRKKVPS